MGNSFLICYPNRLIENNSFIGDFYNKLVSQSDLDIVDVVGPCLLQMFKKINKYNLCPWC